LGRAVGGASVHAAGSDRMSDGRRPAAVSYPCTTGRRGSAMSPGGGTRGGRLALAFGGSGHLLCYQLGVAHRLLSERGVEAAAFGGCSGGAIVAVVSACIPSADIRSFATEYACHGRSWQGLADVLPPDAADRASGRCFIGVTATSCPETNKGGGGAEVLSEFGDRAGLLAAARASGRIPTSFHPLDMLWRWRAPCYPAAEGVKVGGRFFVDGGISAAVPTLPPELLGGGCDGSAAQVLTVTPLAGPAIAAGIHAATGTASMRISPVDESFRLGCARTPLSHQLSCAAS
jgi:hypothetical protein